MAVKCKFCGSMNLRPSHFQLIDLAFLFILRFPVRCRECRERFTASIFSIPEIRRKAEARRISEEHDLRRSQRASPDRDTLKDQR